MSQGILFAFEFNRLKSEVNDFENDFFIALEGRHVKVQVIAMEDTGLKGLRESVDVFIGHRAAETREVIVPVSNADAIGLGGLPVLDALIEFNLIGAPAFAAVFAIGRIVLSESLKCEVDIIHMADAEHVGPGLGMGCDIHHTDLLIGFENATE